MNRALRWLRRIFVALSMLAAVAALVVYAVSERTLRRHFDAPPSAFKAASGPDAIREGERLARVRGCVNSCHGDRVEGRVFSDEPWVGKCVAPNLARLARRYSDADLEHAIRHGIKPDGSGVVCMPSYSFYDLSDADLGAIVAFLRSEPETGGYDEQIVVGPLARWALATGDAAEVLAVELVPKGRPRVPPAGPEDPVAQGRYIAHSTCPECHGLELQGEPGNTPNLAIVRAYSEADFRKLVGTGIGLGGRELNPMMGKIARERLPHLTAVEVGSLYAYLHTLGASPAPSEVVR